MGVLAIEDDLSKVHKSRKILEPQPRQSLESVQESQKHVHQLQKTPQDCRTQMCQCLQQPKKRKLPRATEKIGDILYKVQEKYWASSEKREKCEKNVHSPVQKTLLEPCKIHCDEKKMFEDSIPDERQKMSISVQT